MQMYTFVWFSVAILETPSKKTAVILSHLYVIGLKIVLREYDIDVSADRAHHYEHDQSLPHSNSVVNF